MATEGRVLVVCAKEAMGAAFASNLNRQNLETFQAGALDDALAVMEKTPCDLVLCESDLGGASGLDLLTRMRKEFPLALRVIVANSPLEMGLRNLVNEIAPCAIFTDSPNAAEILRLIALEGAVSHVSDVASVDLMLENEKLKKTSGLLRAEIRALEKQVEKMEEAPAEQPHPSHSRSESKPQEIPPEESRATRRVLELSKTLEELIKQEEVILPVLPEVGLQVQRLMADENCTFESLAGKVGLEQGMSARILQVANSPMYAGLERIRNLQQAVARLGFRQTRNILQVVLAENLFKTPSRELSRLMSRLWLHSLCAAYSNEQIAQTLEIPESDDFFMMGLLHDIGKLLIIHLVDHLLKQGLWRAEDLSENGILGLMDAHHHEFGRQLVRKWQYSKAFDDVVFFHNDDAHIIEHGEAVIVTYFSNLLTRKLGHSLVPYERDLLNNKELAAALNMSAGTRYLLEERLEKLIGDIVKSYQIQI